MRTLFYLILLIISILLVLTSQEVADIVKTYFRKHCQIWVAEQHSEVLSRPKLIDVEAIVITKYKRMQTIHLENHGGDELSYCDGFNFPEGLVVSLTIDGRSCKIAGAASQAQARSLAYVVAGNPSGRSLAIVPVSVNALVLQE